MSSNNKKECNQLEKDTVTSLFSKIEQYRQTVIEDKTLERELEFYVELRTKKINKVKNGQENEPVELILDLKTSFLDDCASKILLLTGPAGAGKSLFCKYLQKLILEQDQEENEQKWLPIYIEMRHLAQPWTAAISEALSQTLLLTESEVLLLKAVSGKDFPQILFIFDGYEDIVDMKKSPLDKDNELRISFYISNGFDAGWNDSKIIIVSREETFSRNSERNLFFVPINEKTGYPVPGSFLERTILPFQDDQITCYLKKYIFLTNKLSEGVKIFSAVPVSWALVWEYEKIINCYHWRELLSSRPFLLSIGAELISALLEGKLSVQCVENTLIDEAGDRIPPKLTKRFIYNFYVRQKIKIAIQVQKESSQFCEQKESQDSLLQKCWQRAEEHALFQSQFSLTETFQKGKEREKLDELLVAAALLQIRKSPKGEYEFLFGNKSIQDFFAESRFEKEITTYSSELFFKRILLSSRPQTVELLADALKEKKFSAKDLLKIADITEREQNIPSIESEENKQNGDSTRPALTQQRIDVVKVNAITILKAAKFKFCNLDLRKANIPGLSLSSGRFDAVDFTEANLQGANLEGAKLKNVNFTQANMSNVFLKEYPPLEILSGVSCAKYTPDGTHLLACTRKDIIVFEEDKKFRCFKEIKRFQEQNTFVRDFVLTPNGKKMISIGDDGCFRVWDFASVKCTKRFKGDFVHIYSCDISSDGNILVTARYGYLVVTDLASGSEQILKINGYIICFKFISNGKCAVSLRNDGVIQLWDFRRRKCMARYSGYLLLPNADLIMNDRMIVVTSKTGVCLTWDLVRRNLIKNLDKMSKISSQKCTLFHPDGQKLIMLTKAMQLLSIDTSDGKFEIIRAGGCNERLFAGLALRPDGRQIALIAPTKIYFQALDASCKNPAPTRGIKLPGTIFDASIGLPDSNIPLIKEKGDYSKFNSDFIRKVILSPTSNLVIEIELTHQSIGHREAKIIGRNLAWINLKRLELQCNTLRNKGALAIAGNNSWVNLKVLNLSENEIDCKGATAIAKNTVWASLEELHLGYNSIGDEGSMVVSCNSVWSKLRILDLDSNKISNEGAASIARNSAWTELEEVYFQDNRIEDKGAVAIGSNSSWKKLRKLELGLNKIGEEGTYAIGRNSTWTELEELYLYQNMIGDAGASVIGENTVWKNLRVLELQGNPTNLKSSTILVQMISKLRKSIEYVQLTEGKIDSDFIGLLRSQSAESVTELMLQNKCFKPIHCLLIEDKAWSNLKTLDLSENLIASFGARAIGSNIAWKSLTVLILADCIIGAEGAQHIAQNATWTQLHTLNLARNLISDQGVAYLSKNRAWANLEVLNLENNSITELGIVELSQNTSWPNLLELNLAFNVIRSHGAAYLGMNGTWKNLLRLNLHSSMITAKRLTKLCSNKTWMNLRELNLSNNYLGDEGALALAQMPWKSLQVLGLEKNTMNAQKLFPFFKGSMAKTLKTIDLNNVKIGNVNIGDLFEFLDSNNPEVIRMEGNWIGDAGAEKLSKNVWNNLIELNLKSNKIFQEGAMHLAKNTSWKNLKILDLSWNQLDNKGVEELCKNTSWKKLEVLNLEKNFIYSGAALALSNNKTWTNLKQLNLRFNDISSTGIAKLITNATWTNLESLTFNQNPIDTAGAAYLSQCSYWKNLKLLDLINCAIGDKGASYLSMNKTWKNLETLYLDLNSIKAQGAEDLAKNTSWVSLKNISLSQNSIGDLGAAGLSQNTTWSNLEVLNLSYNSITAVGAANVRMNTTWTRLKSLDLSRNNLGITGLVVLSRNKVWTNLEVLILASTAIGVKGTEELSRSRVWMNLRFLRIACSSIGDEGASNLSLNTTWTNLRKLDLGGNCIRDTGAANLAKNKHWQSLQILNLQSNSITEIGCAELFQNSTWINLQELELYGNDIKQEVRESMKNPHWVHFNLRKTM